jgi:23S rRNA (guanosine2251-2'-O)-methyltransferase
LTAKDIRPDRFYVYLEGIEDPYNFGYAIRSLYAAGVSGIILPPRNWMSAAGVVARASAGASESLPIFEAEGEDAVKLFREVGYSILCAGIRDSVSVFDEEFPYPVLLVVGGEKRGISRALLDSADRIVRIDYGRDFSGSLSAASAATVLAFEIYRQNRK